MNDVFKQNEKAWDQKSKANSLWSKPLEKEDILEILSKREKLFLTPSKPVPREWYKDISGKKVLCLASSGGQQVVIFSLLKADVYAVDLSIEQIKKDLETLQTYGLKATVLHRNMLDLSCFEDNTFDYVFNPVSMTYIPSCYDAYKEIYRVLKPGGKFLHGISNPMIYLFEDNYDAKNLIVKYPLPRKVEGEYESIEFSHTLEEIFGALTILNFKIIGYYDDKMEGEALSNYISTYMAILSEK